MGESTSCDNKLKIVKDVDTSNEFKIDVEVTNNG